MVQLITFRKTVCEVTWKCQNDNESEVVNRREISLPSNSMCGIKSLKLVLENYKLLSTAKVVEIFHPERGRGGGRGYFTARNNSCVRNGI